ncbi:MAG TPA: hypothetical protein V6D50_09735 [Chroococcales cyanobacterium]
MRSRLVCNRAKKHLGLVGLPLTPDALCQNSSNLHSRDRSKPIPFSVGIDLSEAIARVVLQAARSSSL